jgi:NADH dehydrogenase
VLFQPAYVADAGRAIAAATLDPLRYAGRTFELGGPERISMEALQHKIARALRRNPSFVPVPDAAAGIMAKIGSFVPGAPITHDQWLMLQTDNVVAPSAEGFEAFGIAPAPLDAIMPTWLVQYRRQGRFATAR